MTNHDLTKLLRAMARGTDAVDHHYDSVLRKAASAIDELEATNTDLLKLIGINADLVEAIQTLMGFPEHRQGMTFSDRWKFAQAAIDKATGQS